MWSILYNVKKNDNSFADIFDFLKLCFCIPFSNAKVERFFNFMKIIKTDWRNQFGAKNLTSLIRIKTEGPNSDQFAQKFVQNQLYIGGENTEGELTHESVRIRSNIRKRKYQNLVKNL